MNEQTMNEQTMNANISDCLRTANHFGSQKVYNICNGQITEVPWGIVDYIGVCTLIAIGVAFVILILGFTIMLIREW